MQNILSHHMEAGLLVMRVSILSHHMEVGLVVMRVSIISHHMEVCLLVMRVSNGRGSRMEVCTLRDQGVKRKEQTMPYHILLLSIM
jgi:hypothetical protein